MRISNILGWVVMIGMAMGIIGLVLLIISQTPMKTAQAQESKIRCLTVNTDIGDVTVCPMPNGDTCYFSFIYGQMSCVAGR